MKKLNFTIDWIMDWSLTDEINQASDSLLNH